MDVSFAIGHHDPGTQRQRRGHCAVRQFILAPAGATAGLIVGRHGILVVGDVEVALVHRQTGVAGGVTCPQQLPVATVEAGYPSLIGDRTHLAFIHGRIAHHVGHPFEFGGAARQRHRGLPQLCAVGGIERHQLAAGKAGVEHIVAHGHATRTTQAQYRQIPGIQPFAAAVRHGQALYAAIAGTGDDVVPHDQHLTGHLARQRHFPAHLAARLIQRQQFALDAAGEHQSLPHPCASRQTDASVGFPHRAAIGQRDARHPAAARSKHAVPFGLRTKQVSAGISRLAFPGFGEAGGGLEFDQFRGLGLGRTVAEPAAYRAAPRHGQRQADDHHAHLHLVSPPSASSFSSTMLR